MTCDGGNSWHYSQIQECLVSNVYFINQNTGWILGDYGSILKTTNARRPVGKIVLPEKYSLHQNYPNPFNPVTKIRFEIPPLNLPLSGGERERVMIKIYNILGREIATLINEQLQPGVYEVTWDGTNYPSGVYFYRLTTKDFSQTRKMVLLK
jgi:hypothetical protein